MHNYKELKVWQKGMDFVVAVYAATHVFPKDELYGLTSQLRRAAVSIPANIAEGAGCDSDAEFARFLDFSIRSSYECVVHLQIAERLGYLNKEKADTLVAAAEEISKMLVGLIRHYAPNRKYLGK
ncbi:four helix bundle protein [Anaerolineae bacterium CFX7]|mgnify:CR=1 FL=1|nr:four helix bundle protein [Anaerolineae bacterium CFX7]